MADNLQTAAQAAVYAPDGHVYMVPNSDMQDALKNGGQLAVPMKSPQGDSVWVPTAHVAEAQKNGGKVDWSAVPEGVHDGFWKSLGDDLLQMGKGVVTQAATVMNPIAAYQQDAEAAKQTQANDAVRKQQGRSLAYRSAAAIGENIGVNAKGMEDAADQGDTKGVLGHAAAGIAPVAVAEGLKVAGPKIADVSRAAVDKVKPAITAATDVGKKLASDPDVVGVVSPRAANAMRTAQKAYTILGKLKDALRSGTELKPEDFATPDEAAFPVTTPSDVPLEHIPEDAAAASTPAATSSLKESPLLQQSRQKIRASADAARSTKTFAEARDDQSIQDAMNNDLTQHGRNAYAEARREYAANNSVDVPKWQRIAESKAADILEQAQKDVADLLSNAEKKATTPVKYTKTPPLSSFPSAPAGDLTSLLEQSIAAAKAKKGAK